MATSFMLIDQLGEPAVAQYQHSYLRYSGLVAQLGASALDPAPRSQGRDGPALHHFLTACGVGGGLGASARPPSSPFLASLAREVERLRCMVATQADGLWNRVLDDIAALRGAAGVNVSDASHAAGTLAATQADLEAAGDAYVDLTTFIRHNVAACAQLAAGYDRQPCPVLAELVAGSEASLDAGVRLYMACLHQCVLGSWGVEAILVALSDAWELLRHCRSENAALTAYPSQGRWVAPQKFTRVTRKFWMRPADAPAFKAAVIRHLPLLIYGDRVKYSELPDLERERCLAAQEGVTDAAAVTSVYFDNPDELPVYHERLRRADGATAVRLRWYGEREPGEGQEVFVEQKVHRESWTDHFSSKERVEMRQHDVPAFLAGADLGPGRPAEDVALLSRVHDFLVREQQAPFLRTTYQRTAFQTSDSAQVRISMDADLRMISEVDAPRAPGAWCRDLSAPLGREEVVNFPFVVVEVKLQRKAPDWLTPLLKSGKLLAVPKFSKHIHGTAILFQLLTENVPHWFLPDSANPARMTPATWDELADKSDHLLQSAATWLFPSAEDRVRKRDPDPELAPKPSVFRLTRRNATAPVHLRPGQKNRGQEVEVGGGAAVAAAALQEASPLVQAHTPLARHSASNSAVGAGTHAGGGTEDLPHPRTPTWPVYDVLNREQPQAAQHGLAGPTAFAPLALPAQGYASPEQGLPLQRHSSSSERGDRRKPKDTGASTPEDSAKDLEAGRQLLGSASDFKALSMQNGSAGVPSTTRSGRVQALVRTRVEPKTFFANERTFLAWLQISVLVMLTALSLLSGSSMSYGGAVGESGGSEETNCTSGRCFASKVSGAIIAPVAILFMAYALYMYKKRTIQIMRRETVRYDDQRGPVALVIILIMVTLISIIISLIYSF